MRTSAPSRGRELKLKGVLRCSCGSMSAPSRGRELKYLFYAALQKFVHRRPPRGAVS